MIYLTCNRWIDLEAGTRCQLVDGHDGPCNCRMTIDLGYFGKHTFNYGERAALVWRAGHVVRADEPQSIASNGTGDET